MTIQPTIRKKIMAIAIGLIVLMVITAILSLTWVLQVEHRIRDLTNTYIPVYGHLARTNIRSLERALALRRMVIERLQPSADSTKLDEIRGVFESKGAEVEKEARAARDLINGLIESRKDSADDAIPLVRLEDRIAAAMTDTREQLNSETERLFAALGTGDTKTISDSLARVDALRDDLIEKLNSIRADMLALLEREAAAAVTKQRQAMLIAAAVTALAALVGLTFAILVSGGITRPVHRLLEGTRAVEAGNLDQTLTVTTKDEIGLLTTAFNRMVEQLRLKEHIRRTFGKYVDPRVVEGLIDHPELAAEGRHRVMTVLFCDVKGFTGIAKETTPEGLVKVMNRHFSTMSAPVRAHGGIIDKYIGDAIMAYWGPPFTDNADQARLASLAALDMAGHVASLRGEFAELLGMRSLPIAFDIRIGVATGEALVGSIGSELMMSYTVLGDTVNLASRLEGANKLYGSHILAAADTVKGAGDAIETREIDRVVVLGETRPQTIFEIMGRKGALTPAQTELKSRFAEGLAAYRARRWDEARQAFALALAAVPDDGPSLTLTRRIEGFATAPPTEGWDGCWHLEQK
ncbi:MAG: adenylate/guanylate cyclase domain-containing protein [Parvibaculaceae bacterium]